MNDSTHAHLVFVVLVVPAGSAKPVAVANVTISSQLDQLAVFKDRHEAHFIQIVPESIVG